MIEVKSLSKSFNEVQAVKDISFRAEDGQVTGLLGPNGAGKSTTLRILYGLLTQDSGSATVDGIEIKHDRLRATLNNMGTEPFGPESSASWQFCLLKKLFTE